MDHVHRGSSRVYARQRQLPGQSYVPPPPEAQEGVQTYDVRSGLRVATDVDVDVVGHRQIGNRNTSLHSTRTPLPGSPRRLSKRPRSERPGPSSTSLTLPRP